MKKNKKKIMLLLDKENKISVIAKVLINIYLCLIHVIRNQEFRGSIL